MHSIALWPTCIVLIIAAATDIRSRRIPNWLVVPFLASGIIWSGITGGLEGAAQSVTGISIAVGVLGVLCYLRGMGMGDLKLCAGVGAWVGPAQMISALVATAIAGGFLAMAYSLWHRSLGKCLDDTGDLVVALCRDGVRPQPTMRLDNPDAVKLPYAVAIAIGTLFSFYAR